MRIDSPGGSVMASEVIRAAILNAKAKGLPVVASMGNVAASGGYWVATPADAIFAEPSTITGSIGVFGILPSFQGSMAKLGLAADGIKTTPLSGEPDLLNGPSPAAGALIQAGVDSIYQRFLAHRRGNRATRASADVDRLAQGRVWDGGTARQLGLVDQFGGLDEAIAKAAALAKTDDKRSPSSTSAQASRTGWSTWSPARTRPTAARPTPLPRSPRRRPQLLARRDRRSVGDHGRAEHPGALPRLPAVGGVAVAGRARERGMVAHCWAGWPARSPRLGPRRWPVSGSSTSASKRRHQGERRRSRRATNCGCPRASAGP